jgi:CubicO group peptidase (beta-lactamase class C family)
MASFKPYSCLKVIALCISLLLLQQTQGQFNFSGVDQMLVQHQKQLGNNVVALVYKDGKIIYQKALGDFTPATPAPIASCSKWLTAALVMTFVEEGKLSLDDKISKYLPIFEPYNKGYITIRHCLSHLTGIAGEKPGAFLSTLKRSRYATLEEEVIDFASKKEIEAKTGTAFSYSNIGLNIAGRVLEVIAKKPFDRLMQDRIFRPLGMKNSSFASEKAINPSGGAVSTASDYLNFLVMILNKGVWNGKRILSENSITEMQVARTSKNIIKYAPAAAEGFNYGYGEWIQETDEQGNATVVSSPGLFGTWPLVDYKHGYAAIIFVKSLLGEQKKELYLDLKKAIDTALP